MATKELAERLRRRVTELLATRQEMSRGDFGRRIRRGPSWISEFFAGTRTTNDLQLVITMSRLFGVSVDYLIGNESAELDAGAATLLSTWRGLEDADKSLLLSIAAAIRSRAGATADLPAPAESIVPPPGRDRTKSKPDELPRQKR